MTVVINRMVSVWYRHVVVPSPPGTDSFSGSTLEEITCTHPYRRT